MINNINLLSILFDFLHKNITNIMRNAWQVENNLFCNEKLFELIYVNIKYMQLRKLYRYLVI